MGSGLRGLGRDDVRTVIGGAQAHVVPLVAAAGVVMLGGGRSDVLHGTG